MENILMDELQADIDRHWLRALDAWRRMRGQVCQNCGEPTEELYEVGAVRMCNPCLDAEFGPGDE